MRNKVAEPGTPRRLRGGGARHRALSMRVVAIIVTSNDLRFLPNALDSLSGQSYRDVSVIVVDNASADSAAAFVRGTYPAAISIRNTKDLGLSYGRNQAIAYAKAHLRRGGEDLLILTMNQDVALEPDFVERLVETASSYPDAGSFCGKTRKSYERFDGELREQERSSTVDSAGLGLSRSRSRSERGAGEEDSGQFDRREEVFGVSGSLAMYRLAALDDVAYCDEYFDLDFFSYEEDMDLAWRLRRAGWKAMFDPAAHAFRHRSDSGPKRGFACRRQGYSKMANYLATRNRMLAVAKNDSALNVFLHLPFMLGRGVAHFAAIATLEPSSLAAYADALRLLPKMFKKRRSIRQRSPVTSSGMRKWYS